ncbi:DinB superfamily protein [Hymenobacter daecheongensis DSM 21074]|uniref:DinB superfamily protein n=1 Tax=Hymenobacter daecheongensis DSM 21074 TaxID=1121955 RepID=A0A1M6GYR3_9BACT|nr:DinB family protein [Hymenobacter daecheongensis]SHJ15101.1 DinB superfamily protein [Hymenobacter daecheongensis DSM 21074]
MTPTYPDLPEVWLRGPLPDYSPLLLPVAHALLQAREELTALLADFPDHLLWHKPAGLASPGFHLQHLTGVLDRLTTYARAESLTPAQIEYLRAEGQGSTAPGTTAALVQAFHQQVERTLGQLRQTPKATLTERRGVGRAQLPSTVLGLLVHAAEHTMRHLGQLLVTVRVLRAEADRYA